jgi:hypothetical protein
MIYYVTEVANFREPYFRAFFRVKMLENKGLSYGSLIRKLPPPPITPTPLALRRWGGCALAQPATCSA